MGEIVWYKHYGKDVAVDDDLMGKHRENCLCYRCGKFAPGENENCQLASLIYLICCLNNMVLPVWECPEFETKMEDLKNEYGLGCA